MRIKVEFSEASLFGQTDPETEGIDVRASVARFAEALENAIYDAYPNAEIVIKASINDRHEVNGQTDHDECPWIGQIIEQVWNGDDWLEYHSLVNTSEAAEIIGITRQGVIAAINRGSLKARKMGGSRRGVWVIERTEAERYQDERGKPTAAALAEALGQEEAE